MTHRAVSCLLVAALLAGCGSDEASPSTEPTEELPPTPPPEPEPVPEPEPEPVEVPTCPTDTWGVAANGPTRATTSGVEAAGWARSMGQSWEQLRVCRTVDEDEVRLSCAPVPGGAECSLSLPDEHCTATLPIPMLPAVVGQLVDTTAQPSEGTWRCQRR